MTGAPLRLTCDSLIAFDLEHTFRFFKHTFGWTAYRRGVLLVRRAAL